MDQNKPYFDTPPPETHKAPSATQIDAVGLRKAVSESLRPVLTAIPAQIAEGVAKAMAEMPKEPTYTADPDKIATAVGAEISKLKPPEFNFEMPDVFKLDQATIEAITHNQETANAIDQLGERLKLIGKQDSAGGLRALMQEMMKNPKLWLNVRFTDSQKFMDKLSETIVTGIGGPSIARDNSLQAILAQLRTGVATTVAGVQTVTISGTTSVSGIHTVSPLIDSRRGIDIQHSSVASKQLVFFHSDNATHQLGAGGIKLFPTDIPGGSTWLDLDPYLGFNLDWVDNTGGAGSATLYVIWSEDQTAFAEEFSGGGNTQALFTTANNNVHKFIPKQARYCKLQLVNGATAQGSVVPNIAILRLTALPSYFTNGVNVINDTPIPVRGYATTNMEAAAYPFVGGVVDSVAAPTVVYPISGSSLGEANVQGNRTIFTGTAMVTAEKMGTTGTLTNTTVAITSTTLAALSTSRRGMIVHNDSTEVLFLKYGSTASATSYTFRIAPGDHFIMPMPLYSGTVSGIAGVANGTWRITTW